MKGFDQSFKSKQLKTLENIIPNQIQPTEGITVSPYLQQYETFFNDVPLDKINQYENNLRAHKILYLQSQPIQQTQLKIIDETSNSTAVNFLVFIGKFQFQIKVLNLEGNSPSIQNLKPLQRGSQGQIYYYQKGDEVFVVKSIFYRQKSHDNIKQKTAYQNLLYNIIIEFCYCKLFSVLRIGPYVKDYFGFDLLIYDNTAEFPMEYCPKIQEGRQFLQKDLKQSMKFMHSMNFIHGDIKPSNVRYSLTFKRSVFIDFGFCMNLAKPRGNLFYTTYFGTPTYSCNQMKQALAQRTRKQVDLYYNDIFGLRKTIQFLENTKEVSILPRIVAYNKRGLQQNFNKYGNFLLNIRIKSAIYGRDLHLLAEILQKSSQYLEIEAFQQFMNQMRPSRNLVNIFNFLMSKAKLFRQDFKKLTFYYGVKIQNFNNNKPKFSDRIMEKSSLTSKQRVKKDEVGIFIALVCKQDITQVGKIQKAQDLIMLEKSRQKKDKIVFWKTFVRIAENLYTNQYQILEILEIAKKFINIKQWEKDIKPEYIISTRMAEIRNMLVKNDGICLLKLSKQQSENKVLVSRQQLRNYLRGSFKQIDQIYDIIVEGRQKSWKQIDQLSYFLKKTYKNNQLAKLLQFYLEFKAQQNFQIKMAKLSAILSQLQHFQKASKCHFYFQIVHFQILKGLNNQNCYQTMKKFDYSIVDLYHYCFHQEYVIQDCFYTKIFYIFSKNRGQFSNQDVKIISKGISQFFSIINQLQQLKYTNFIFLPLSYICQFTNYCKQFYGQKIYQLINFTIRKQMIILHRTGSKFFKYQLSQNFYYLSRTVKKISKQVRAILHNYGWSDQQIQQFNGIELFLQIAQKRKQQLWNQRNQNMDLWLQFLYYYNFILYDLQLITYEQLGKKFDQIVNQNQLIRVPYSINQALFLLFNSILNEQANILVGKQQKIDYAEKFLISSLNTNTNFGVLGAILIKQMVSYRYQLSSIFTRKLNIVICFMRYAFIHPERRLNCIVFRSLFSSKI